MTTAEKMRAAEKLLSRLSERKKLIIEHVKQQTESYSQHLASKLLINGIDPPSWLRDPSASCSKGINEEDLISKLLSQYPQPSACWSVSRYPGHSNLVISGDHNKYSEENFMENAAPNKDLDQKNDSAAPRLSGEDHGECALDTVPELDVGSACPEDQAYERISDVFPVLDQSLARIQRSKSRQKALELRSSAQAAAKSGLRQDSISDVVPSQIRFSLSIADQPGLNVEVSQSAEPCIIDTQSCENRNVIGVHGLSREMGAIEYSERTFRFEANTEAPNCTLAFPLGHSSIDYEENASSQNAKVRSKGTVPISDTQPADNFINKSPILAGTSDVSCQNYRDSGEDDANFLCKDEGKKIVYTGDFSRSGISSRSQGWGCDSTKADCSFDDYQGINITMIDSGNELPPDHVDSSPMKIHLSNVRNEGCNSKEHVLEDFTRYKERDTFLSSSSIQCNACIDEISDMELPCASSNVCGDILVPSSAVSERQVNDSQELLGLVKPSGGLSRRLTRSQSPSYGKEPYRPVFYNESPSVEGTRSISDCEEKSAKVLQNSSGQLVPSCLGTNKTLDDDKNVKLVMASDMCLLHHADKSRLSTSDYSKQSIEVEFKVATSPLDSLAPKEPKQVEVKETEEYNLEAFNSRSRKKISCSFHDHEVSLDEGICGGKNQPSSSRQLPWMSDISSEGERAHRDSFEPDVQECTDTHSGNFGPVMGSAILNVSRDSSEAELNCRSSEVQAVQHETHNLPSKSVGITDIQIPHVEVKHGLESTPVHCMQQGDCNGEISVKGELVSSAPVSKYSRLSFDQNAAKDPGAKSDDCLIEKEGTNPIAIEGLKQCLAQLSHLWPENDACLEDQDSSLGNSSFRKSSTIQLDGENLSLERRLRYSRLESWPQVKRRKLEHQQAHGFATSQRFRVTKPHTLQRDLDITFPKNMEVDIDTRVVEHVDKTTDDAICSEANTDLTEGILYFELSQHGEVGSCYAKHNEHKLTSPVISNKDVVASISRLAMKESRNSQECPTEGTRTSPSSCEYVDARISGDKHCRQNLYDSSYQNLNLSHTQLKEIQQSPKCGDGSHLQHSVLSSRNGVPQLNDVDQSMPVFEGFIVNAQTDTDELDFAADEYDLCELDLPRTTLERASILAEICRSASLDRPSSHFLPAFKFQEPKSICKSLTDDVHLDHKEFGDNYSVDADFGVNFQSLSSSSDDYKDALDGMSYSCSLAYSGERYGWDSRNLPPSPVGKLWNQLSSYAGSSGKCSSSNPELTCFPIEEDPCSSEENKTMEENVGDTLDETDSSLANHCDKRQPLKDLTNMSTSPPLPISAEEKSMRANPMDFLKSKFSVAGTHEKALLGPKHQSRKNSETNEKQTSCTRAAYGRKHQLSTVGPNAIKRTKESVSNSISKPIVSNKISLKGQDQKLSLRRSGRNNIVSNVSSFIPQLQQKQAAATCKGKVNVKVKALEAAEIAKREEEKKLNQRNQRKEALNLERAKKLEENNLKQMELEKKKREEERKKKYADIIAKKRPREEEEKKEKKRMRPESRPRQKEHEEKKRVERPDSENQRTKDGQMNRNKELNESKRPQNRETTRGEGACLQKTDTNLILNELVVNHEVCGTSGLSCDEEEIYAAHRSPRNEDLIVQKNNQGNSYDISPYQCSDDEDEDEEDAQLPTKKYVPSWASKSSISLLLPLKLKLDPDEIFPPDSFCSIDEVLVPRKLQQKQVAA